MTTGREVHLVQVLEPLPRYAYPGVTPESPSATSHQLRILRDLGLVRRRREGRSVFYALADDHLGVLLKESLYHVDHNRLRREV